MNDDKNTHGKFSELFDKQTEPFDRLNSVLKQQLESALHEHCDRYRETGDPFCIWIAYRISRQLNLPIPEEVYTYFDSTADRLWTMVNLDSDHIPDGKKVAPAIIEAMGMKGHTPNKYFRKEWHQILARQVLNRVRDGEYETYAVEHVAKECEEDESTVWRAWRPLRDKLG